jgi:hypothetical protein
LVCAEIICKTGRLLTWGMSFEKIHIRGFAHNEKKSITHVFNRILRRTSLKREEDSMNFSIIFGLEHIYLWVQCKNFPAPYSLEELGEDKYGVLRWVGANLAVNREVGAFQLLILGPPLSQKTLFLNLIAQSLRVYFIPTGLNNFDGAEKGHDLWVLDGVSSSIYTKEWGKSPSATALHNILEGGKATLVWGENNQYTFQKTRNVPVILVGSEIPSVCFFSLFFPRLRIISWEGHSPVGFLEPERIGATILSAALMALDQKRQQTYFNLWHTPDHLFFFMSSFLYRDNRGGDVSKWGEPNPSKWYTSEEREVRGGTEHFALMRRAHIA